jgi:urease accessory protein UreE
MILINRVLGHCDDVFWVDVCEQMEAQGLLEMLTLELQQLRRKQFRARTDKGTVVGVSLRDDNSLHGLSSTLRPGSIVFYEENQRVVLAQIGGARMLVVATLNQFSTEDALTLGHFFGCLGWPMRTRRHPTHVEIFIECNGDEEQMESAMRACPLPNVSWTLRDRRSSDPLAARL